MTQIEVVGMGPDDLRRRRRQLGMSQAELGRSLGLASNTIARWERDELPIGSPVLLRLALERLEEISLAGPLSQEWALGTGGEAILSKSARGGLPAVDGVLIGRDK